MWLFPIIRLEELSKIMKKLQLQLSFVRINIFPTSLSSIFMNRNFIIRNWILLDGLQLLKCFLKTKEIMGIPRVPRLNTAFPLAQLELPQLKTRQLVPRNPGLQGHAHCYNILYWSFSSHTNSYTALLIMLTRLFPFLSPPHHAQPHANTLLSSFSGKKAASARDQEESHLP